MATNEDLKLVAEYDGWKFVGRSGSIDNKREVYERKHSRQFLDCFQYADSFDKLIPVARKVVAELIAKRDSETIPERFRLWQKALADVSYAGCMFNIATLFASIVSGIKLINEVKK